MIHLKEITTSRYEVYWENNKLLGYLIKDVDGYFYFWQQENSSGCWAAYILRMIAEKLDEINEPYKKELEEYFKDSEKYENRNSK